MKIPMGWDVEKIERFAETLTTILAVATATEKAAP